MDSIGKTGATIATIIALAQITSVGITITTEITGLPAGTRERKKDGEIGTLRLGTLPEITIMTVITMVTAIALNVIATTVTTIEIIVR